MSLPFPEGLPRLIGRVAVFGMGNTAKGDDGAGSVLAQRLQNRLRIPVIDAGMVPENCLGQLAREKPGTLLLVDAVHFGGKPGEVRVLSAEELQGGGLSTHCPSFQTFLEALRLSEVGRVIVLGIEPKNVEFGESLGAEVEGAVQEIEGFLVQHFGRNV